MAVTVLHLANVRLGATFTSLGAHGREHRAQVLATLASLGDLAVVERVQLVLISGDLFDCAVPAPATLKTVQGFFAKLRGAGIAVAILPGARDPDGIFQNDRQGAIGELHPGAVVLGPQQPIARFEALNVVVAAVPLPTSQQPEGDPPIAIPLSESGTLGIGLAYRPAPRQHLQVDTSQDLQALARMLGGSGLRYVGLGGELQFAAVTVGETTVCSPGVPEPLDWGQEQGSVAVVRLHDDGGVKVERRRTGTRSFARRELAITPENAGAAVHLIGRLAQPDLALEVILTGPCPINVLIDPASIETELAPSFFHLRVVDRTRLVVTTEGAAVMPQGTIVGNFARVMESRLRETGDGERAVIDREAYQIGMSLLQGGSPRT